MSVRSAQAITVEFITSRADTQAATNADSLPTGTLVVNGTDNGASVTVTNVDTGRYKAAVTLPTLAIGDVVELSVAATVNSIAGKGIVWRDTKDVSLDSSGLVQLAPAQGPVTFTGTAASGSTPATAGLTLVGGAASTTSGGTSASGLSLTGGAGAATTNGASPGLLSSGGGTTTVSGGEGFKLTATGSAIGLRCIGGASGGSGATFSAIGGSSSGFSCSSTGGVSINALSGINGSVSSVVNVLGTVNVAPTTAGGMSAATSTTATIGSLGFNNFGVGGLLVITAGTGYGQFRTITGFVESTGIATVDRAWDVTPDLTSTWEIRPASSPALDSSLRVTPTDSSGITTLLSRISSSLTISGGKVAATMGSTDYSGNTVQTGDAFGRIGATGSGLTSVPTAVWASGTRTLTALGFTLGASDLASGIITAAKFATDAIDSNAVAASATSEQATAVWANVARTLTAATNITSDGGTISQTQLAHLDADVSSRAAAATALSTAQWSNTRAGYLDSLSAGAVATAAAVAALNNLSAAQVKTQAVAALATDTYAEPSQGAPAATATLAAKVNWLYAAWRNKKTETSAQQNLFGDDGTTVLAKASLSDDGTTLTVGEFATGP